VDACATGATLYYSNHQLSDESCDNKRRAHLKNHGIWPRSRKLVRANIFETERVLLSDLVAFQSARKTRSTTYAVKLKHGTEYLAHNLGRQINTKGARHSVASQVAVLGLATDVDSLWITEHIGLLYIAISFEGYADSWRTYVLAGISKVNKYTLPLEE
jgi:hypothetical protein